MTAVVGRGGPVRGHPPPTLRGRALQWLAQRDHSRLELREKLLRWQAAHANQAGHSAQALQATEEPPSPDAVDAVLDALQAAGHLSDERFAESRIHARAARFGNRRIAQELRQHGAPAGDAALQALKASELDRARAVWQRKFSAPPASAAERARQMRFLAGRGFTGDTIRRVLAAPDEDTGQDSSAP